METLSKEEALAVLKLAGWVFDNKRGGFINGVNPEAMRLWVEERGWRKALEVAWAKQYQTNIQVKV